MYLFSSAARTLHSNGSTAELDVNSRVTVGGNPTFFASDMAASVQNKRWAGATSRVKSQQKYLVTSESVLTIFHYKSIHIPIQPPIQPPIPCPCPDFDPECRFTTIDCYSTIPEPERLLRITNTEANINEGMVFQREIIDAVYHINTEQKRVRAS